jgi:peptidyl-dipeptidase Dcp
MNRPRLLILAASLAFAFNANAHEGHDHGAPKPAAVAADVLDASNPFAKPSPLPLHYPQFDKIKDEHFLPAYKAGMAQQLKEIDAIANNPKAATFDNTIVALEKSGQLLTRVSAVFSNLQGANTNDNLDKVDSEMSPKLAAHSDAIYLNDKLFQRVKSLYDKRDKLKLDAESRRVLSRYYTDFVRAGANLSAADKEKLKALNAEIATLQSAYSQTNLKEVNASAVVFDKREELAGMSDAAIETAAAAAKAKGMEGKYLVALTNTTHQAPLAVLTNRASRERLMNASLNRGSRGGEFDTRAIIQKLLKLRAERAQLQGYENFAAYSLEDQTAQNPKAVNALLAELAKPAVDNARKEAAELQKIVDAEKGGFQVAAHDWAYYADKVRAQKYAFDEGQLKPYFELNNVLVNGALFAATKLYGITFKERKDLPVYNPDVRVFDVYDTNGKLMAIFLADMYARSNKQGGAWMNEYVSQSKLLGNLPVVGNHLNIPKPPAGEPTLLTWAEVTTTFHEFGHALHGIFSNVKFPRLAGTNVPRDFVEYPSQVNQMWASSPEILANYAKHYKTGEVIPKALLDKVNSTAKFNQGYSTTENLASSILDQKMHQLKPEQVPADLLAFEAQALKEAGVDFAPVPPRYRASYFSHSMGGYSAGYYSYMWSEKLDADTVEWFKEKGGLQRKLGDHFRKTLLSRGGSDDAMALYRNFRGTDAKIQPLLERRGLVSGK